MTDTTYSKPLLFLRACAYWVVFIVSTVALTFPVIIASFVYRDLAVWLVDLWVSINLRALKLICGLYGVADGLEHLPNEPSIVFAKHQSTFETFYIQSKLPKVVFVAKRELLLIPFFGWALASMGFVMIDRRAGRSAVKQMIEQYSQRKQEGHWLVIFPEGTRKAVGDKPDYKIGGALLAVETNTPVVPVALNAGEFWPRHSFIKWPGAVTVSFGPPIYPEGKTADEVRTLAKDWIENRMSEITQQDRFPY